MANRAVVVDLLVRTGQFTAGMRRASHDMASETTNMETKARSLQMQVGLLGVGMVAFAAVAVKKWAEFDQAMARVEATGGEASKRIDELNDAAKSDDVIQLGYNAVEASNAIYELVKAGVSAEAIIGGGMAGALALAAAETMDAGDAAQIMASALTQFNLAGSDSAHVADLITAGAGKAQGSAHDLGLALKQSGLVANQFGLSIEQTTGTLAFFASAGMIGSDAGTSLRTMLLHLAGPSTKAAKLMDTIGLEIYGANGKMVDMATLADNLQSSMGKLTEEQRNQALATIFGADATRAASLLYREGGQAVEDWTDKVNDADYAIDVARKRMDNLSGDIKKLSATWDRSMIEMGQSADAPLRLLVSSVTTLVDRFGNLHPVVQGVIMALTGGGGLVILATLGIAQIVGAVGTLQAGLVATGVISEATGAKMSTAFGKTLRAAGALTAIVLGWQAVNALGEGSKASASIEETTAALLGMESGLDAINERFKTSSGLPWLRTYTTDLRSAMDEIVNYSGTFSGKLDDLFMHSGADKARETFHEVGASLASLVASGDAARAKDIFKSLNEQWVAVGGTSEELLKLMPEYTDALTGVTNAETLAGGAAEGLAGATVAVTAEEVAAQKAHDQYVSSIIDSFTSFLSLGDIYSTLIDKQKEQAQSAADSTKSTKDSWEDFVDEFPLTSKQYIKELEKQVKAQEKWADNLIGLTGRMKKELPAELQTAASEMIDELRGLGPAGAAQIELLKGMSEAELRKVVDLFNRQGVASGQGWADGVEAAQDPTVDVDMSKADASIADARAKFDGLGRPITTVLTFKVNGYADARAKYDGLGRPIGGSSGSGGGGGGGGSWAGGGGISGPGTGTSDNIHAMLSNGEHVLTASDVQKAGGQDGVYRMRSAIQSGMLRFAKGGAVNGHSVDYWRSAYMDTTDRLRLQAQIRDQRADLRKKGKEAVKGLDRRILVRDIRENEKKLADAKFAASLGNARDWEDRAKATDDLAKDRDQAREDRQRRDQNLENAKSDYRTSTRRGELKDDLTGSKSSALSTLDRIRSDVLPNLTGRQKVALAEALDLAEKSAGKLFSQIKSIDDRLEAATAKAEELRGISDSVKSGLVGGFSLDAGSTAQVGTVNPFTGEVTGGTSGPAGKGMLSSAQAYAGKLKTFAGKLKALADKGFTGVILQEIAAMGVDVGIPAADALLGLSTKDTSALNQAYKDIATYGGQAGQAVTEGFYKGGLAAADGVVDGLEAQKKRIQDTIMAMAMAMQDALKAALGISVGKPAQFVGQDGVLLAAGMSGPVADAKARLASGVTVAGGASRYSAGGSGYGTSGDLTAALSDQQVERLAVAFETGNVRNINRATAQQNLKLQMTYGSKGR